MRFKSFLLDCDSAIIYGNRGSGKSSLLALIADLYTEADIPVYSQYAYKGAFSLPLKKVLDKSSGVIRYDLDKNFLYSRDFCNCAILIDEAATVYPARKFSDWTDSDDDFFNFLRKKNIHLFISTQYYDKVDLNVRRACSYSIYLTPFIFNLTRYQIAATQYMRILDQPVDRKTYVSKFTCVDCDLKKGFFSRKKFYNNFDTYSILTFKRPLLAAETPAFTVEQYSPDF